MQRMNNNQLLVEWIIADFMVCGDGWVMCELCNDVVCRLWHGFMIRLHPLSSDTWTLMVCCLRYSQHFDARIYCNVCNVFLLCLLACIFQCEPTWMALYSLIVLMCFLILNLGCWSLWENATK